MAPPAPAAGSQPQPDVDAVEETKSALAVADANADLERRRLMVASYFAESYQKQGFGNWTEQGNLVSVRRVAAGLLSLERSGIRPRAGEGVAALPFPKLVAAWAKSIIRYAAEGSPGIVKTQDYDMEERELVSLLYVFKNKPDLLTNDAIYDIITKATFFWWGSDTEHAMTFPVGGVPFSETENHVMMILSCQYLINQWIYRNYRDDARFRDFAKLGAIASAAGANVAISSADFFKNSAAFESKLLSIIGRIPHAGFFETNSRAYQAFTLHSLLNLYVFAESSKIRAAAKNALDYAAAKFAFQSLDSKRFSPHRRYYEYAYKPGIWENDPTMFIWAMLSGGYAWPDSWTPWFYENHIPHDKDVDFFAYGDQPAGEALWAGLLSDETLVGSHRYRLPVPIHDFMLDKHHGFWSRFQDRFTDLHYRAGYSSRYFHDDRRTPYLVGNFQPAPELVFVTNTFMNVAGGNFQPYPLQGEWCLCKPIYDFFSRPSAMIPAGHGFFQHTTPPQFVAFPPPGHILPGHTDWLHHGDWGGDGEGRTKMSEDILNVSTLGDGWWDGLNLGVYKNFTVANDPNRVPVYPHAPLYEEDGQTEFLNEAGTMRFRFQQVFVGESESFYLVLGQEMSPVPQTHYFWEVVPSERFDGLHELKSVVLARNYAAGPADRGRWNYALSNGEIVEYRLTDRYPILAVTDANGKDVQLNRFWYDGAYPEGNPLIEVHEVDDDYQFTGVRYAESPSSGVIYVWNPFVNRFLLIDSSDPQNPTSSEKSGVLRNGQRQPPLRYHRPDEGRDLLLAGGNWGLWHGPKFCPEGQYAVGYKLRVERPQGDGDKDDTSLNAVALECKPKTGGTSTWVSPHNGYFGTWNAPASCSNPLATSITNFVSGGRERFEESQGAGVSGGHDDTAGNDVQLSCSGGGTIASTPGGPFGTWKSWQKCPAGSAVCGISVRTEEPQGDGEKDDSALNGVRLFCCSL